MAMWPRPAHAQQPTRLYRIGFLRNGPPPRRFTDALLEGLAALGYVEGQQFRIEYGIAGTSEQLPEVARELVGRNVDVIIASGTPPTVAAKNATSTIPIVFVASIDPLATGVVESLGRPGGNVTGLAGMHADLMGKRLELLKEVLPALSRVAVLGQAKNPGNAEYIRQAELAAPALGLDLQIITISNKDDFEHAFQEVQGLGAAIELDDVLFTSHMDELVELAVRSRVSVIYAQKEFVRAGGFMAYGADLPDQYRRAAAYIDRILKGAGPADLPVQQPTKLELAINLRTAEALRIMIPPTLLARADEVIE